MRFVKRLLLVLLLIVAVLAVVLLVSTFMTPSRQIAVSPCSPVAVDPAQVAAHLGRAVQFKTVSYQDPAQFPAAEFEAFRAWLIEAFPKGHATLQREVIAGNSLLYTWKGSDPELQPLVFLAHYDVVPVEPGTENDWKHGSFSGEVADGYIWGRGAIDFKCGVTGVLEAAEALLNEGFTPARTLYFAFGHDEELGGVQGAANMAKVLQERGVKALFTLDEGMAIVQGVIPGLAPPLALIGLAEKGYVSLELTVESKGGHSSNPPPQSAIGILSAAITQLEAHQMPARLEGPIREMLETAGPEMSFPMRTVMTNLWMIKGIVTRVLTADPATNAALRTTTAPTIFNAGSKDNVLPIKARAVVNFRILPGDTVNSVLEHAQRVIHDERVKIGILANEEAQEPSPVSSAEAPSFAALAQSLRQIRPDAVVAPSLVLGGTDSKHYANVAENNYRIQPLLFTEDDIARIHATNERLSVEDYVLGIQTYAQVMRNAAGK